MIRTLASVDATNPWPGLPAYQEDDAEFFRGRSAEVSLLLRLVVSERVTVLYGASGLGKTSILNAGLFPILRLEGMLPVSVRLIHGSDARGYDQQILSALIDACEHTQIQYPAVDASNATVWGYFHNRAHDLWDRNSRLTLPVFVFDQFEEIFKTGASLAERNRWLALLADIIEDRVPEVLSALDQSGKLNVGEFELRREPYRIIIALREDFLPDLTDQRFLMPSIMSSRLRLLKMTGSAALNVVNVAPSLVAEPAKESVVRLVGRSQDRGATEVRPSLEDLEIDPTILSVVLSELNEERVRRGLPAVTDELLSTRGPEVLRELYERSLRGFKSGVRNAIESRLISSRGNRETVDFEGFVSAPGLDRTIVDELVARRLLRVERRGGLRVELTHDVLAPVVHESRKRRERNRRRWNLGLGAAAALILTVMGSWLFLQQQRQAEKRRDDEERRELQRQNLHDIASALSQNDVKAVVVGLLNAERSKVAVGDLTDPLRRLVTILSPNGRGPIQPLQSTPTRVVLSPDSRWAAAGTASGTVTLWDLNSDAILPLTRVDHPVQHGGVAALTFSSDAQQLLIAWKDGTAQLWRCVSAGASCVWGLQTDWSGQPPAGPLIAAAFLPGSDSAAVFSGSGGMTLAAGGQSFRLLDVGPPVRVLAISPVVPSVGIAGRDDGSVWLIDISAVNGERAAVPRRLGSHASPSRVSRVYAAAFTRDGTTAVTVGSNQRGLVWNMRSGHQVGELRGHTGSIFSVDVSSDPPGRWVVTASADGTARVWDRASGREVVVIGPHQGWVRKAAFTCLYCDDKSLPAERNLGVVTADDGGTLRVWSLANAIGKRVPPTLVAEMRGHNGPILDFVVDTAAGTILSVSRDRTLRRWTIQRPDVVTLRHDSMRTKRAAFPRTWVPPPNGPIYATAVARSRDLLVTAGADQSVRLWRRSRTAESFSENRERGLFDTRVELTALALSPVSECVAVPGHPNHAVVKLWAPASGSPVKKDAPDEISWTSLPGAIEVGSRVTALAFAPDGSRLGVASSDRISVYQIDSAACRLLPKPPISVEGFTGAKSLAFGSADGGEFLAVATANSARVWYRAQSSNEYQMQGEAARHIGQVEAIAFSSNGKLMATGGEDQTVQIWEIRRGVPQFVGELLGHDRRVRALAFSPDNRFLATGGDDRIVRIWDVGSLSEIELLYGHTGPVWSLAFVGRVVLSSSVDGTARLTPCDLCGSPSELARQALAWLLTRTPDRFTKEERNAYADLLR